MFVMTPNRGLSSYRKRVFTVKDVESDDPVENDKLAVPLLFDYGYSKVIIDGSSTATEHEISKEPLSIVQPSFIGLPGLEEQLRQLSTCVARVNLQLEERFQMLAGCVPILISGSSGTLPLSMMPTSTKTGCRHRQNRYSESTRDSWWVGKGDSRAFKLNCLCQQDGCHNRECFHRSSSKATKSSAC
jgi:hypothetical protein